MKQLIKLTALIISLGALTGCPAATTGYNNYNPNGMSNAYQYLYGQNGVWNQPRQQQEQQTRCESRVFNHPMQGPILVTDCN